MAYHLQTDGTTERFNQEISTYLSIYCTNNPETWSENLPILEFAHNSKTHSGRNHTPFELMYGIKPHGIPTILEESNIESTEQRIETLDNARREAIAAHKLAMEIMQQRIKARTKPFTLGQKVWLEAKNLKLPFQSRKIAPKQIGPFKITKTLSPLTYQLELPETWKIHNVFHSNLLSEYTENDIHGPNPEPPPPDLIEGEEEYEVEAILNHETKNGKTKYYIKWKGYDHNENSWEPEAQLLPHAKEILQAYKEQYCLYPKKKRRRKTNKLDLP